MVAPQKIADKIVAEIFKWYEKTPFPSDIANQMAHNRQFPVEKYKSTLPFPQVITKSPLCHISVKDGSMIEMDRRDGEEREHTVRGR
jgi:hypothetical protein